MATPCYARYVLVVLLFVYANDTFTRSLLTYLYAVSDEDYDDDNAKNFISLADATGISTSEYGILAGYGFTISYVVFGFVMGRAADVYNRKLIIFYGMVIWNVAIVGLGLSNNFAQLLLSRIVLGIGQSFGTSASLSMIADYFPPESLGQASGLYTCGVHVGGGVGSLSIVIAEFIGWKGSAYVTAASGFLLALLVLFTVKEPVRTHAAVFTAPSKKCLPTTSADMLTTASNIAVNESQTSLKRMLDLEHDRTYTIKESLELIFGQPLFLLIIVGGMFRYMGAFTLVTYLPDFYSQVYPEYNTIYSYCNATVMCVGGALSSYLGGYAADRWEESGQKRARMYIPAFGTLLGVPAFFMVVTVPSFYASMFFLFVKYLISECWYGPIMSVQQKLLPPRVRGVGIACYTFGVMTSGGLMAYGMGLVLDAYTSDAAIRMALIISVCGLYVPSAIFYFIASSYMPELSVGPLKGSEKQPLLNLDCPDLEAKPLAASSNSRHYGAARSRSVIR